MISWQCKKQTIVANSTTEAEYVAAANCCGQVLWIQNQMLDYGYNFMNTKIFIDNESTICIVKNPVFHSKTKHIEIRHHFIRDSYEKRLIQVIKIHTDHNVVDLLTKALDVSPDLIFADSHNMVAYLEKSEDNADFAEIVDFLNASPIRYALTVSPTVYVSYIEQFWSTAKIKTVNNETQIRAKVDGKTIVITESSVRRDLYFNDEDAVFNDEYDTPSHTKKVFANMRRQGKDFSGTVIPLFATMLIQSQAVEGEGSGQSTEPQHTPTTASSSHVLGNTSLKVKVLPVYSKYCLYIKGESKYCQYIQSTAFVLKESQRAVRRQTTLVVAVGRWYSYHSHTMWCRAVAAQPLGVPCCAPPLGVTAVAAAEPAVATTAAP
ncbi:hypothetical protein Tco_1359734 [Tanacetum coccineum]